MLRLFHHLCSKSRLAASIFAHLDESFLQPYLSSVTRMKMSGHHSREDAFISITGSDQLRKSFDRLVQTSLPLPVSPVPKTGGIRDKVGSYH